MSSPPDANGGGGDPAKASVGAVTRKMPRRPLSPRKKWLFRLLAVTLVPGTLLAVLEFSLRVCGSRYPTSYFVPAPEPVRQSGFGFVVNQDFGRRFFPPALVRQPVSNAITVPKPKDAYRIFILGESAALGFPDPSSSFARILEVMLHEQYPATRFEIINTAMVAINSHVVLPIARDCAQHQPDLFVVYLGNNEVLGPFGAGGVIGPYHSSLRVIRNSLSAKSTAIGQLLQHAFPTTGKGTPRSWTGMAMFMHSQARDSDPRLTAIRDHFSTNLKEICDVGVSAGASMIVGTVPVNLKDSAPFGSLHAEALSEQQLPGWDKLYQEGIRLAETGKTDQAIRVLDEAAQIDPSYAELQYRLGRLRLTNPEHKELAHLCFVRARETDTLRFRSDEAIQAIIRRVAGGRESEGVHLADIEKQFAANCPDGIPGGEFFLEHVHLNFHGNYLVARGLFETLEAILPEAIRKDTRTTSSPPTEAACAERLAYTDWNRLQSAQKVLELLQQPPFTNQLQAKARLAQSQQAVDKLHGRLDPAALRSIAAVYARAVERSPDDWMIRLNFAQLLLEQNEPEKARLQLESVLPNRPYVFEVTKRLGDVLMQLGHPKLAIEQYRATLKLVPGMAKAEYGLALALAAEGRISEGLNIHKARVQSDSDRAGALEQMAQYLLQVDLPHEAKKRLKEALDIDPENASVHAQLGTLLAGSGDREGAIEHLEAAFRIRPDWSEISEMLAKLKQDPHGEQPHQK